MAQFFEIHPHNPQQRLIRRAVEIINKGGVVAFPTDSSYALCCHLGDKRALDRIRAIRRLDDKHNFTLICSDLTELSNFAKVGNDAFRLIKRLTPGAFTFVLKATKEVPKRLMHPKRKSVGLRIPDHPVAQALLREVGEPLFSTTLILPDDDESMVDPYEIRDRIEHEVDLIIDAGDIAYAPTTIISFVDNGEAEIVRQGIGIADELI
ncbi:MAG: threonylcarbamoyl-AMP synthase [Gammaproteobacteria bacterium]|nr:MAG: threonylcarbamoyl-AMP synthase [Gammaproteobacteria bacterium]